MIYNVSNSDELFLSIITDSIMNDENTGLKLIYDKLDSNEKLAAIALLLREREIEIEELPVIPNNEYAENIRITSINSLKQTIFISYDSLQERKWIDGKNVWTKREVTQEKTRSMSITRYLAAARNANEWNE